MERGEGSSDGLGARRTRRKQGIVDYVRDRSSRRRLAARTVSLQFAFLLTSARPAGSAGCNDAASRVRLSIYMGVYKMCEATLVFFVKLTSNF